MQCMCWICHPAWRSEKNKQSFVVQSDLSSHWILPIIQGFVQMETCCMDFEEERRSSPGSSPDFNNTFRMEPLSYNINLISRRSRHRAGKETWKKSDQLAQYEIYICITVLCCASSLNAPINWLLAYNSIFHDYCMRD